MGKKAGGGVRVKQVGSKIPKMVNPMEALQIPPDEMIRLPPQPDRKYQIIWPIQETFSMNLTGFSIIYPSYLDAKKTVKLGRRLSKDESVPAPTVTDISYALQKLQVRHAVQPYKGYSPDISCQWDNPGRVLVDVPMVVPEGVTTQNPKQVLLKELATIIPALPYRIERLKREAEEQKVQQQQDQKKMDAATTQSSAQAAAAKIKAATSNKKKNKGKKKK